MALASGCLLVSCARNASAPEPVPTLTGQAPIIIAHRGASGALPEHTLEAYALAIEQGADFIEPDLVMTSDGVLIARHDRYLSTTTNIEDMPQFGDRKRTQATPSGTRIDWWAEDFTLAEIKTLRARQPFRGRSDEFDDLYEIPTFQEIIDLAVTTGVGLYPETKSPGYHAGIGLDMKAPLLAALDGVDVPIFIQSFEPTILRDLDEMTEYRLVQLKSGEGRAIRAGFEPPLEEVATYADGIGPAKFLLWDKPGQPSDFVARAHALGLSVHVWTFRDDAVPDHFASPEAELRAFVNIGVDGLFTDFPDSAVAALQGDEQTVHEARGDD